jgi:hypothetical protein
MTADNLSGLNAFNMLAFGVKPQETEELESKLHNLKGLEEYHRRVSREATREYRLALKAFSEGREEDGERHRIRAGTMLNATSMPPRERTRVLSDAMRGYESLADEVARRWARTSPEAMDALIRRLQRRHEETPSPFSPPNNNAGQ